MSTSMAGSDRSRVSVTLQAVWSVALLGLVGFLPAHSETPAVPDNWTLIETLTAGAAQDLLGQLALSPGATVHLIAEANHPANWMVEGALAKQLRELGCTVVTSPEARAAAMPGPAAVQPPAPAGPGGGTPPVTPPGQRAERPSGEEEGGGASQAEKPEGAGVDSTQASGESTPEGEEGQAEESEAARRAREMREQHEPQAAQAAQEAGAPATAAAAVPGVAPDLLTSLPAEGEVLLYRVAELELSYPWVKRSWLVGPRQYGRVATVRLRASHLSEPGHRVAGVAQGDRVAIDEFPGSSRPYLEGTGYPFEIRQPEEKSLQRFVEPVFVTAVVAGLVYLFHENQK